MKSISQPLLQSMPPKVFISYSHVDKRWLDEFNKQLAPYLRGAQIDAWNDTRIKPGENWKKAIENALTSADVGVLLVTPNFLASRFIAENELPPLLEGKRIFWIAVSPCGVEVTPIARFQAANDPSRPLNTLRPAQRAQEWVSICKKLSEAVETRPAEQAEGSVIASPSSAKTVMGRDASTLSDSLHQKQPASSNAGESIASNLVVLLRNQLSETKARDIGNYFGVAAGQGLDYWDRLPGDGMEARLSVLVTRALQMAKLPDLVDIIRGSRPDLNAALDSILSQGNASQLQVLHNLPPRVGNFIGRKEDMKRVFKGLADSWPLITIEGFAGVGKTRLALEVGYACLPQKNTASSVGTTHRVTFQYVVWVSTEDKPEQKFWYDEVLKTIAQVTNFFSSASKPPERLDEKKREVERILATYRVLLIVNNFETIEDPDLVSWIRGVPEPSKVLITSRKHMSDGAWSIDLGGLKDDEAVDFVRQHAEALGLYAIAKESTEGLLPLVKATWGNPQAIRQALGLVKVGSLNLWSLVGHLSDADPRENMKPIYDYLFAQSWGMMDEVTRKLLLVTPLFRGPIRRDAFHVVSGLTNFTSALEQLVNLKLLEVNYQEPRFIIHPMTREFARIKLDEQPALEVEARERWSKYYFDFVHSRVVREKPRERYWNALVTEKMESLDDEWLSIQEVLRWVDQEGQDQMLLDLMMLLVHYMDSRYWNLERLTYVMKALKAARRLGQKEDEALLYIDALGWTYAEENHLEEAEQAIQKGMEIVRSIDDTENTRQLLALGQGWLARMMIEQGRTEEANNLIQEALAVVCRPVIRYRINLAAGDIALRQRDSVKALEYYREAVEVSKKYACEVEEQRRGEGGGYQTLPRIGLALLDSGKLEEARNTFKELLAKEKIIIGKLYAGYGLALVSFKEGNKEARALAEHAREELNLRTPSDLLMTLIDQLFADIDSDKLKTQQN